MLEANEVRNIVEESLMENSNANVRKCNMLREEKKILSGILNNPQTAQKLYRKGGKRVTLRHIILIGMTVRRIQRMSGYSLMGMNLVQLDEEADKGKEKRSETQTLPLFSNFIISSDSNEY